MLLSGLLLLLCYKDTQNTVSWLYVMSLRVICYIVLYSLIAPHLTLTQFVLSGDPVTRVRRQIRHEPPPQAQQPHHLSPRGDILQVRDHLHRPHGHTRVGVDGVSSSPDIPTPSS